MLKDLCFESERLFTDSLNIDDVSTLFEIYSDSDAMKYRGSSAFNSINDAELMVENQFENNGNISKLRLAIKTKSNSNLIGTILLKQDSGSLYDLEIGFSFAKKHWNKGCAKETLKAIENQFKTNGNIESLMAWCKQGNASSIRVFEASGFAIKKQNQYPESLLFCKQIKL
jgi:[ribosomal protein S5]-alanine N-acetyltransferase